MEKLPGSPGCFICDNNNSNPRALHLELMWDEATQTVHIALNPDETWCGYSEVVHGGLVAAVLDEAMAWAIKKKNGEWAFTADFRLRYKKPVSPGRHYRVVASCGELGGRKIEATAKLLADDDQVLALAEAVFLPVNGRAKPRGSE